MGSLSTVLVIVSICFIGIYSSNYSALIPTCIMAAIIGFTAASTIRKLQGVTGKEKES
jgi:MFS superfamily sulfate permease-like transporter